MKYKLTKNTKEVLGITLYQIEAIESFSDIQKGELGGWVEKEDNLSQKDNAWVFGDAHVSGNAQVYGNAQVSGGAWVFGDAQVSGNAQVYGNAQVSGGARVSGGEITQKDHCIVITNLLYNITITPNHIKIGCEFHTKEEWSKVDDSRALRMDGYQAVKFWRKYKDIILGLANA